MIRALSILCVMASVGTTLPGVAANPKAPSFQVEVGASVRHDTSPPLREMAIPLDQTEGPGSPLLEIDNRMIPLEIAGRTGSSPGDPSKMSIQRTRGLARAPVVNLSVDGLGISDYVGLGLGTLAPAAPNGDVGTEYFIQYVNLMWAVFDKTDGALVFGPFYGNSFWDGFGGACETNNAGDPLVLYDHVADRWVFSQFTGLGTPRQCFAVSTTNDPLGPYHRYEFDLWGGQINDYPKIGIWIDEPALGRATGVRSGYYMTSNDFAPGFEGVSAIALERDEMLVGGSAATVRFEIDPSGSDTWFSLQPPHLEGNVLPPAGACAPFVQAWDDEVWSEENQDTQDFYAFFNLCVNWAALGSSTLIGPGNVGAGVEYDANLCNFGACQSQPETTQELDTLGQYTMYRAQVRGLDATARGGEEYRMVVSHTSDVGGDQAGVHWAELDLTAALSDSTGATFPSIIQTATFAPDGDNRSFPSIAMDRAGNIAVSYSVMSSSTFPSMRYSAREPSDPLGTLRNEAVCVDGSGSQTGSSRWNDYTSISVDPVNGCTFWMTGQYVATTDSLSWDTRICSFHVPNCMDIFADRFESEKSPVGHPH